MQTKRWTYLVLGLGKTGMSCVRHLHKKSARFAMADSRSHVNDVSEFVREHSDIDIFWGAWDLDVLLQAEVLVISPGIALHEPVIAQAIEQGVSVSSDIELFMAAVERPVIAVTGSNGKSTVVSLLGDMAKHASLSVPVGGNIGLPVLDLLDPNGSELCVDGQYAYDAYVLELSSFQLERLPAMNFACACILNLSEDHMDRYDSYQQYVDAKQRVYLSADVCVFNRDDQLTNVTSDSISTCYLSFGVNEPNMNEYGLSIVDGDLGQKRIALMRGDSVLLYADDMRLQGRHNLINGLSALAMSDAMGWDQQASINALMGFTGLSHRCEYVDTINGVMYINDSKGTNVGATLAAIDGLCALTDKRVVLIAGGEGKGADFSELHGAMKRFGRAVVCIGMDGPQLMNVLSDAVDNHMAVDMNSAVQRASELAHSGDYVLLSPACASFDMFKNFEHRGDVFIDCVTQLGQQGGGHV
ncbi:MAG: UDP-N-acetylmuramoyl-L-alanine--D-glutamate ligase [Pseudomonadota bacterium]